MKVGRSRWLIPAAGALIETCLAGMLALGDLSRHVPVFFALFGIALVAYLAAVWRCERARLRTVVLFGVLFRATLLPSAPTLSGDIYRYVWDGRVQAAGINPYRYPPASDTLSGLRDRAVFPNVNHPDVPTIYPPLAEAFFRVCYAIRPSLWTVKVGLVAVDFLTAWFLLGLIRLYGLSPGLLLVYLWHPLSIVEVAGSGHMDVLGIALLAAGLLYAESGRFGRAVGALALSFLAKFFALCMVPVLWRWMCTRDSGAGWADRLRSMFDPRRAWPLLIFPAAVALGYWPYAGPGLFDGLATYARNWTFNAPVYDMLQRLLGDPNTARLVVGLAFGAAVVAVTLSRARPVSAGYALAGLFLWLTPTLQPWYALWVLPFLVFSRSPAWLVFLGLVTLSYQVLPRYVAQGVWAEAGWVKAVEAGGFVAVWAGTWAWGRWLRGRARPVG